LGAVSYSPSIVTMALSCTICVQNRDFFIPRLHSTSPLGGLPSNIAIPFGEEKLEWWGYPMVKKLWRYV